MKNRKQYILLTLILFSFWVVLSGKLEVKYLTIGLITALTVSWIYQPFFCKPFSVSIFNLFIYLGWLLKELVKANIEVALLVLNPKMLISPRLITFKKEMSNPVAYLLLANSITLTPGTITVDVQDGFYTIHALTEKAALSLAPKQGEGEMPARVGSLFLGEVIRGEAFHE